MQKARISIVFPILIVIATAGVCPGSMHSQNTAARASMGKKTTTVHVLFGLKAPESFRPACSGSIVWETCVSSTKHCRLSGAMLDSYGRNRIGAFVPVEESDFGCCGPLFGGELALQKVKLDPAEEPVS